MGVKKVLGGSAGAVFLLIVSQVLACAAGMGLDGLNIPAGICNMAAGALYLTIALFLTRLFVEKVLHQSVESVGLTRLRIDGKWIVTAVLLPAAVTGIYLLLPGGFVRSEMTGGEMFAAICAGVFFTGIAAGFVEEIVFRGVSLHLIKAKWGPTAAVLLPSVLFGAVHIIGMDFSPVSCLLVLSAGTMVGIMFSLIALEGGSVWNSGLVHALWNILMIGGILSIGEAPDPYSVMTYVLNTRNFLLTGGEFGVEASAIAAAGYCAVSLLAMMLLKKKRHS